MLEKLVRTYSGSTDPRETAEEQKGRQVALKAAMEGMVLLKNENHVLPLEKGKKIALYGGGADKTIKGGTGSGDVNERDSVTVYQGLVNAGFDVTTGDWIDDYNTTYDQARLDWKEKILSQAKDLGLNEFFGIYSTNPFMVPSGRGISKEDIEKSDTDTAIYVISRVAGEGADRFAAEGDYYLSKQEKENLDVICGAYDHVILVINAGGQIDLSYANDYKALEAIVYMVQAGMEGGNALAHLLAGKENFSGKLSDTWARAYEDYPSSKTFSHNNGDVESEEYHEDIYVGYRYFDTFDVKPQYAFGYGMSYTDFTITPVAGGVEVDEAEQMVTVKVNVTNIGNLYSGKEVVQIYASCPQGSLEKERRRLCGFTKTKLLSPGESEDVMIAFPIKRLASYFEYPGAWIVEEGTYGLWMGNAVDHISLIAGLVVDETTTVEKVNTICLIEKPIETLHSPKEELAEFEVAYIQEIKEKDLPVVPLVVKEENIDKDANNATLENALALVKELTEEELISMVIGEVSKGQGSSDSNSLGSAGIMVPGAAGETSSILDEKYHIPGISMADGPAGLRLKQTYYVSKEDGSILPENPFAAFEGGFFVDKVEHENADTYYQYCTAIPVGTLLAQTWNIALIEEVGAMIGNEMRKFQVTWWLAPGMNIHRNPLCGRNFEYYSEDPVVSGKIATAMTNGVQSVPGVGTTIKHFACNNQEDNRMGSNSILSERALREIYLRGFEIAVKESQPMAIMTSYNLINGVHAANNYDLCTEAARNEWGFKGIIMTDWTTTSKMGGSEAYGCVKAGNDLIMPGTEDDFANIRAALKDGKLTRAELEACVARMITVITDAVSATL